MALVLTDFSGNSNTLTNNNTATEVTTSLPFATKNVSAVQLASASSQSLSASDSTTLSITDTITIEFWYKPTSQPTTNTAHILLSKYDYASTPVKESYQITYENNADVMSIRAYFSEDGTSPNSDRLSWNATLNNGTWYHLALTFNPANATATECELYSGVTSLGNGDVIQDHNVTAIYNSDKNLYIGAILNNGTPEQFANGQFDEIRIWNTVRTSSQIISNYAKRLNTIETGLKAYWPLESWEATPEGGAFFFNFI